MRTKRCVVLAAIAALTISTALAEGSASIDAGGKDTKTIAPPGTEPGLDSYYTTCSSEVATACENRCANNVEYPYVHVGSTCVVRVTWFPTLSAQATCFCHDVRAPNDWAGACDGTNACG
jgi:hypothetical protein